MSIYTYAAVYTKYDKIFGQMEGRFEIHLICVFVRHTFHSRQVNMTIIFTVYIHVKLYVRQGLRTIFSN